MNLEKTMFVRSQKWEGKVGEFEVKWVEVVWKLLHTAWRIHKDKGGNIEGVSKAGDSAKRGDFLNVQPSSRDGGGDNQLVGEK